MRAFAAAPAPHIHAGRSVTRVMAEVLLALLPGVAAHLLIFGPGLLLQVALSLGFALGMEAAALRLRGEPPLHHLADLSAAVTAVLFALCLPPLAPWWVALAGMAAALLLGKHAYGGLGHNPFNPAMVGLAAALLCFPREMAQWWSPLAPLPLSPGELFDAVLRGVPPPTLDTLSSATPLDTLRSLAHEGRTLAEIRRTPLFGEVGGKGWEWIAAAYALGGAYLLWRRVIRWQVPLGVIGASLLASLPFWLSDPDTHPSPLLHLASGGLMLAAFFVATDPVSGATTPRGRLLFGAGVGVLTLAIRRWGSFPDGVAFAVLSMNLAAPLLDRVSPPRPYGHRRAGAAP